MGSYVYNGFEQRAEKTAGSTATDFVFDRMGHLLEEANHATGTAIREYIWLDDMAVAMVQYPSTSILYIHTDHLGTPQKITSSSAAIVWDGAFDPFGNVASLTGSVTNNLRFPGQYYDAETALAQNWNRDYDASIGRYVESDPIGLAGGINTYAYVLGNPTGLTDPDGTGTGGEIIGGIIGGLATIETGPGAIEGAILGAEAGSALQDALDAANQADQQRQCECDELNQGVQNAKAAVGALGKCQVGMSPWQIRQRYNAWLGLAVARAKRDQKCWNGGDVGHQQAQADAWTNVGNCGSMM